MIYGGCFLLPHSPWWLFHVGRKTEAQLALETLETTQNSTEAEKEEILALDTEEISQDLRKDSRQ